MQAERSKLKRGLLSLVSVCILITLSIRESKSGRLPQTPKRSGVQATNVAQPSLDQKETEARQTVARADELRAMWTEAALRQAIEQYDKASLIWSLTSNFSAASQSALKSGDVCFLLSEFRQAEKRYQQATRLALKTSDWLSKANAMARMGRLQSVFGYNDKAEQYLTEALDLLRQHDAKRNADTANTYGETLGYLGEVTYSKGDFAKSREQLSSALEILHDDPARAARIYLFRGYIAGGIGNLQKAFEEFSESLKLYKQVNDKDGEGLALTALGLWHSNNEEDSLALELHERAIEIFRAVGDRDSQGIALNALGQRYQKLRQYSLALDQYQQALRLFDELGAFDRLTGTLFKLASIQSLTNHPDDALALFERCVRVSHKAKKFRSEAYALNEIATIQAARGHHDLAIRQYLRIKKFYESIGDLRGQATALNAYGDLLLKAGQPRQALEAFRQAQPLSDTIGHNETRISTLHNLARANLALGLHEVALSQIRQALDIIESVRANVDSPDFRVSYFSGERKHYQLAIEILMQLDELHPGQGFAAQALLMSEESRARLLRDLVSKSRTAARDATSTRLLEREHELRGLFRVQAQYRVNLSLRGGDPKELAMLDSQLAQIRAQYQETQAQLRQDNPRLFSVEQTAPITLQQIQSELRDDETMLLEYALGEERSFLWAVTASSLASYELPARNILEDAARELYRLTTMRQESSESTGDYQAKIEEADRAYMEKATRLSQVLLGPVAQRLGHKRLLIVTEGALQQISLEALPLPVGTGAHSEAVESGNAQFLIEQNEIVVQPSIAALIAIRHKHHRTRSPNKLVAIIADPVFGGNDVRIKGEAPSQQTASPASVDNADEIKTGNSANQTRSFALARLMYASEEADAIAKVAPWGTTLVAKGFDATREAAIGPDIRQYQIVHFATHGLFDSEHPELSGIVLSAIDREGREKNGLMPLYDIYNLDLSAELTVLSACQTALGKDLQGEGLVGLTHSFMSAGTSSVVASLWKVDDRATADLMPDFYDSILQKGMPPSAALRAAKLKMMKDKRYGAPYYWAGFVLQGEYSNHIVVARHQWVRFGLLLSGLLILIASVLFVIKTRRRRHSQASST